MSCKEEQKMKIMRSSMTDKQKLQAIFDLDKERLQETNPQLYYAILGVLHTK